MKENGLMERPAKELLLSISDYLAVAKPERKYFKLKFPVIEGI